MKIDHAVITLPGTGNYAVTLPDQITFIQGATPTELEVAIAEIFEDFEPEKEVVSEERTSLAIIPTFNCNLKCIYCYARGGESKEVIKLIIVKKALEHKKKRYPNARWLDLYLVGGGEPLLYFNLVKEIYTLALQYFENVQIHVVTNGTFNNSVAQWLVDIEADVRISYDGIAQTYQRPLESGGDSCTIVEATIEFLTKSGLNPVLQMIITSKSIDSMIDNAEKALQLGAQVIKVEPALASEVSRGNKSIEPNPTLFARKILELIQYIAKESLPLQVDTGFFTKPATGFYCGMADSNFTLTPDGLITPCVEVARTSDPYMERINLGEITEKGVTLNHSNSGFLKTFHYTNQMGGCMECSLRMICLGGCPMANVWRNGLPLKKSTYTCAIEHALLPELLLMMAENPIIMKILMENIILD